MRKPINKRQRLELRRNQLITNKVYDLMAIKKAMQAEIKAEFGSGLCLSGDIVSSEDIVNRESLPHVKYDHNGEFDKTGVFMLLGGKLLNYSSASDQEDAVRQMFVELYSAPKGAMLVIYRHLPLFHKQAYRKLNSEQDIWVNIGFYDELRKLRVDQMKPDDVPDLRSIVADKLGLQNDEDFGLVYDYVRIVEF